MIAIVHSIYSQSVHALALNAGSMDNKRWAVLYLQRGAGSGSQIT